MSTVQRLFRALYNKFLVMGSARGKLKPSDRSSAGEARYLFEPENIKAASEPSEDGVRLIWLFLRLLRKHEIDYATYAKEFRRGEKTFRRDVAKLREIGSRYQFSLTRPYRGRIALAAGTDVADRRKHGSDVTADTMRAVADALGEIVANDVYAAFDTTSGPNDPFLRLAMPRLIDETRAASTYRTLRDAWRDLARVRFRYPIAGPSGTSKLEERIVEPHLVTYYDGRYYLVAYDARPKTSGWRQFALDRIADPIGRAGTFVRRTVPQNYSGEDALGLLKSVPSMEIAIAISPEISGSVLARRWQRRQRATGDDAGWPVVTFDVCDLGEAVRWAFGFGENARVVSPPEAVTLARRLALSVARAYAPDERKQA